MRKLIKRVWGKTKPIVIAVLGIIIGISWTYFYITFSETYREAEQTWTHIQEKQMIEDSDADSVEKVKTESDAHPEGGEAVNTTSPPPSEIRTAILPKIHILESSGGKNDSCKNKGLVNGYGYMQSTFHWRCYKTKAEVEAEVEKWFAKNLQDKTLAESLCYYNKGIVTEDCEYARKFAKL